MLIQDMKVDTTYVLFKPFNYSYRSWDKIAAKTIAASCKDFPNINRMKIDLADNPNDLYFE